MGYFKRPIRRSEAKTERLAFFDAAREVDAADWTDCPSNFSTERDTFIRFLVIRSRGNGMGLFRSSDLVDGIADLQGGAQSALSNAFRWFNRSIKFPRRMPKTAVCWFRSDAEEAIGKMREIIEAYRLAGYPVHMKATRTPGRIVYQDEIQIAAIPYLDRRHTISNLR